MRRWLRWLRRRREARVELEVIVRRVTPTLIGPGRRADHPAFVRLLRADAEMRRRWRDEYARERS